MLGSRKKQIEDMKDHIEILSKENNKLRCMASASKVAVERFINDGSVESFEKMDLFQWKINYAELIVQPLIDSMEQELDKLH